MEKRPLVVTLTVTLLIVVVGGVYLGMGARPILGLDLQGGISAVYEPQLPEDEEEPEDFEEILDETIEIIRSRVDAAGVAEPDITRQGTNVLVQLPGVQEADRIQELIGRTAQLTFRPVDGIIPPGSDEYDEVGPDCSLPIDEREEAPTDEDAVICGAEDDSQAVTDPDTGETIPPKYRVRPVALSGSAIEDAFPAMDQQRGNYVTSLDLDAQGGQVFAEMTSQLACERDQGEPGSMAIVVDDIVETASPMAPEVACGTGIRGGSAQISMGEGGLQEQQERAEDLALVLRTGALPITLEEATFQTVSPTLGQDSLQAGLLAGLIGLALVALWLVFFYRALGFVAIAEVAIYGVLVMALISLLGQLIGFALTLAGVAGIIVSIGITADSAIIFFERIRDEVNLGKTVRTAVKRAHESAWRTNLAGNIVTMIAAAVLYFLATGPVRGFAFMLGLSSVLDLMIMWFFARPVVMLLGNTRVLNRRTVRASEAARAEALAASSAGGGR